MNRPTLSHLASLAVAAAALAGSGACTGVIGDAPGQTPPVATPTPPAATLKRLTRAQYANAVHDVFGADVVVPSALEPDVAQGGFVTVGGSIGSVSRRGVEQYEAAAYKIVDQAFAPGGTRDALVGCSPASTSDDACARSALAKLGRRILRRPLDAEELDRWADVAKTTAATLGDFHAGLGFAVAGLLQTPSFLFRVELGEPDPDRPGVRRYSAYEMASRLAFFLWNTTPDDALLDAAESGALGTDDGLAAETERLLASPRSREAVRNYFTELLQLAGLDDLSKDGTVYRAMSADLGPSAREETLRTLETHLVDREGDFREIFTTRRTFVNRKLAALYGVAAPSLDGFGEIELPDAQPRRGLLGQASFLALYAHPTSSSATMRGKFVRAVLLCGTIPAPPANVNTSLNEPDEQKPTLRDRIRVHLETPFCAACHKAMDPIGLGLENFDGIGAWRKTENGADIDASGTLDGTPFRDAAGLGKAVADHPDLAACTARRLFRYASGVVEPPGETPEIDALGADFARGGYRFVDLMRKVVLSQGFRTATEGT